MQYFALISIVHLCYDCMAYTSVPTSANTSVRSRNGNNFRAVFFLIINTVKTKCGEDEEQRFSGTRRPS